MKIHYRLTEAARKAALLAGAAGTAVQTVDGDATLTPERLACVWLAADGTGYAIRPTAKVGEHVAGEDGWVSTSVDGVSLDLAVLDSYHATPDSLLDELERLQGVALARATAEEAAARASEAAAAADRARWRREVVEASREAIDAWLADPDSTAVGTWGPPGELSVRVDENGRTVYLKAGDREDLSALMAEAERRRIRARERAAEQKAAEQAAVARAKAARLEFLRDWIKERGPASMRERLAEGLRAAPAGDRAYLGLVPYDEVIEALKVEAFAPFEGEDEFVKLTCEEIDHHEDCSGGECDYSSEAAAEVAPDLWARMKKLRGKAPEGAEVEPRKHWATCKQCGYDAVRYGVLVRLKAGPLTLHREFAA